MASDASPFDSHERSVAANVLGKLAQAADNAARIPGSSGVDGISSNIASRAKELARNAKMLISALKKQMDDDPEHLEAVVEGLQTSVRQLLHSSSQIQDTVPPQKERPDRRRQGNQGSYTNEALQERLHLMNHPEIDTRIKHIWQHLPKHDQFSNKARGAQDSEDSDDEPAPAATRRPAVPSPSFLQSPSTAQMASFGIGPKIVKGSRGFKQQVDPPQFINFEVYQWMARRLHAVFVPEESEAEVMRCIKEDWDVDSQGEKLMPYSSFRDGMFNFADIWCESVELEEYLQLLRQCFAIIFRRCDFRPDTKSDSSASADQASGGLVEVSVLAVDGVSADRPQVQLEYSGQIQMLGTPGPNSVTWGSQTFSVPADEKPHPLFVKVLPQKNFPAYQGIASCDVDPQLLQEQGVMIMWLQMWSDGQFPDLVGNVKIQLRAMEADGRPVTVATGRSAMGMVTGPLTTLGLGVAKSKAEDTPQMQDPVEKVMIGRRAAKKWKPKSSSPIVVHENSPEVEDAPDDSGGKAAAAAAAAAAITAVAMAAEELAEAQRRRNADVARAMALYKMKVEAAMTAVATAIAAAATTAGEKMRRPVVREMTLSPVKAKAPSPAFKRDATPEAALNPEPEPQPTREPEPEPEPEPVEPEDPYEDDWHLGHQQPEPEPEPEPETNNVDPDPEPVPVEKPTEEVPECPRQQTTESIQVVEEVPPTKCQTPTPPPFEPPAPPTPLRTPTPPPEPSQPEVHVEEILEVMDSEDSGPTPPSPRQAKLTPRRYKRPQRIQAMRKIAPPESTRTNRSHASTEKFTDFLSISPKPRSSGIFIEGQNSLLPGHSMFPVYYDYEAPKLHLFTPRRRSGRPVVS
mmetsp:Transcript_78174/g.138002  ORF Transcript_78174/g.138002 Transcript_78174/m.138002 type:complete len:857 (-) Transcript_78174:796-3366(-)